MSRATVDTLARLIDVTPAKLRQLIDQGVIQSDPDGTIPAEPAILAYCRHLHAQLKKASGNSEQTAALDQQKLEADVKYKQARARQEELKLEALGQELNAKATSAPAKDADLLPFRPSDTLSGIARILGIAVQTLHRMVKKDGKDTAPPSTDGRHYPTREILRWYYVRTATKDAPVQLREAELRETLRLKRAKADLAEGKAVPIDDALALATQIYETCWQTITQSIRRYAPDPKTATQAARADFQQLRKRLDALARPPA